MRCKLDSTENPRSFEKYPKPHFNRNFCQQKKFTLPAHVVSRTYCIFFLSNPTRFPSRLGVVQYDSAKGSISSWHVVCSQTWNPPPNVGGNFVSFEIETDYFWRQQIQSCGGVPFSDSWLIFIESRPTQSRTHASGLCKTKRDGWPLFLCSGCCVSLQVLIEWFQVDLITCPASSRLICVSSKFITSFFLCSESRSPLLSVQDAIHCRSCAVGVLLGSALNRVNGTRSCELVLLTLLCSK